MGFYPVQRNVLPIYPDHTVPVLQSSGAESKELSEWD